MSYSLDPIFGLYFQYGSEILQFDSNFSATPLPEHHRAMSEQHTKLTQAAREHVTHSLAALELFNGSHQFVMP